MIVALAILAAALVPAASQAPERLPAVTTEVVRVDVVVTTKGGKPRLGLTAQDFVVLEDGQPQKVVQFDAYASAEVNTPQDAAPGAAPARGPGPAGTPTSRPPRFVVLAVDDFHMDFANLTRTKKALARFLERDVAAEDRVGLTTTSGAVTQDFTSNPQELRQAVERLTLNDRRSRSVSAPYLTEYQAELILRNDPDALRVAVEEIRNERRAPDPETEARMFARGVVAESMDASRASLTSLVDLVSRLGRLPGRKIVVLTSEGFLTGLALPGGEGFDLRRVTDAGTRAGVVIYALDARGLVAGPSTGGNIASNRSPVVAATVGSRDSVARQGENAVRDAMNALAVDTGGLLVEDSNDLAGGLRKILKDTETYYALAYEPLNPKRDGAFRAIEVRLPAVRDVRLRARKGYYAPDDRKGRALSIRAATDAAPVGAAAASVDPGIADMNAALASPDDASAIPVQVFADFMSADAVEAQLVLSGRATVPCPAAAGCPPGVLQVAGALYDEAGILVGSLAVESLDSSLVYQKAVPVKPGRYRARLVVREGATGKLGSASAWVTIPDLAAQGVRLSSVFLSKKGETTGASPAAGELTLASAQASRRFKPMESLFAQVYAYNPGRTDGGGASLVTTAEIWKGGIKLGATPEEPMDAGRAGDPPSPYTRSFKLASFAPADYELRFVVTDRVTGTVATSQVAFTVE